jgi:hypothetical protein
VLEALSCTVSSVDVMFNGWPCGHTHMTHIVQLSKRDSPIGLTDFTFSALIHMEPYADEAMLTGECGVDRCGNQERRFNSVTIAAMVLGVMDVLPQWSVCNGHTIEMRSQGPLSLEWWQCSSHDCSRHTGWWVSCTPGSHTSGELLASWSDPVHGQQPLAPGVVTTCSSVNATQLRAGSPARPAPLSRLAQSVSDSERGPLAGAQSPATSRTGTLEPATLDAVNSTRPACYMPA